jgi:hypothetical protein
MRISYCKLEIAIGVVVTSGDDGLDDCIARGRHFTHIYHTTAKVRHQLGGINASSNKKSKARQQ